MAQFVPGLSVEGIFGAPTCCPKRSLTHGYEATHEAAMAAFAKSWRREAVHAANP
jgi:hypothetical protein